MPSSVYSLRASNLRERGETQTTQHSEIEKEADTSSIPPPMGAKNRILRAMTNHSLGSSLWNDTLFRSEQPVEPSDELLPQITRRNLNTIAIGTAIGTGLFLKSGETLHDGGPLGILLGYAAVGSVVYCLVVSIAEMVSSFSNVGPVRTCDRFVDSALGFAMGWNAWYHWAVVIPAQIIAATALTYYWNPSVKLAPLWPAIYLFAVVGMNCFPPRIYGRIEFVFSTLKVLTALILLLIGLYLALRDGPDGVIGFRYWRNPGAFANYLGIKGSKGEFLSFWACFIQAAYSYFGADIPVIVAPEVVDAPDAVPKMSVRVWRRLTLLYLGGLFVAGLIVPHDDPGLARAVDGDAEGIWEMSPFLIALNRAGPPFDGWVSSIFVASFILSAVSAAAGDVFVSSRYFYFLSRSGHAPEFLGRVYPREKAEQIAKRITVPWAGVAVTAVFSLLCFAGVRPDANAPDSAKEAMRAFKRLSSMTTAAGLLGWIGMLFSYIRFYHGTEDPANVAHFPEEIAQIKRKRHRYQPYLAYYALFIISSIMLFHGWSIFNKNQGNWYIYIPQHVSASDQAKMGDQVATFVTSYLPIPIFLLLVFGNKLINQTKMKTFKQMDFKKGFTTSDPDQRERRPRHILGRLWWMFTS